MRIIVKLSQSKSSSVLYECANTLISISNSQKALKLASSILIQLLNSANDNNIKLMVLTKLTKLKSISPKLIEDQISEITESMKSDSFDIKMQIIDLIRECCSKKTAETIIDILQHQILQLQKDNNEAQKEFLLKLLENVNYLVQKFTFSESSAISVFSNMIQLSHVNETSSIQISKVVKKIFFSYPNLQNQLLHKIFEEIPEIKCSNIIKIVFVIFSEVKTSELSESILNQLLPYFKDIERINASQISDDASKKIQDDEKKVKFKTVILPDGTYGTQMITEGEQDHHEENLSQFVSFFKNSPNLSSLLVTMILKLLHCSNNQSFLVSVRANILLLFCELGRFYSSKMVFEIFNVEYRFGSNREVAARHKTDNELRRIIRFKLILARHKDRSLHQESRSSREGVGRVAKRQRASKAIRQFLELPSTKRPSQHIQ